MTNPSLGFFPEQGRRGSSPAGPFAGTVPARRSSGQGLVDLLIAITVAIIVVATAIPVTTSYLHEASLRGAAFHVRGLFRQVRSRAAAEARYVGVVFDEVEGDPVFSIYADSNSNGIRRVDIDRGVEEKLREPYRLSQIFPGVRYGSLPAGATEPFFPGLQFGKSHIVSFSPLGSSTSGTLYLSNDYGLVYAVVVLGSTGRVRVARYRGGKWQTM